MDTELRITLGAIILSLVWDVGKLAIILYLLLLGYILYQKADEALDNCNSQYVEETAPICVVEA